jgi:hypothetical protein
MPKKPLGGFLVLRHASQRPDAIGGLRDYDVLSGDKVVGRIFRPYGRAPTDRPWFWTIAGAIVAPAVPHHGFARSRDDAWDAFAKHWRKLLSLGHASAG